MFALPAQSKHGRAHFTLTVHRARATSSRVGFASAVRSLIAIKRAVSAVMRTGRPRRARVSRRSANSASVCHRSCTRCRAPYAGFRDRCRTIFLLNGPGQPVSTWVAGAPKGALATTGGMGGWNTHRWKGVGTGVGRVFRVRWNRRWKGDSSVGTGVGRRKTSVGTRRQAAVTRRRGLRSPLP